MFEIDVIEMMRTCIAMRHLKTDEVPEDLIKKVIQAAVLASVLTSLSAFAHHPAEAIIDADTWAMIDANLQEADSPHLDLDLDTMGLSPKSVRLFLEEFGEIRDGICFNKKTNKKITKRTN